MPPMARRPSWAGKPRAVTSILGWQTLFLLPALASSAAVIVDSPPPPPPSPPGYGCSGEQVYSSSTGSVSVSFTAGGGRASLGCTFLIHAPGANGLTLQFQTLALNSASSTVCKPDDAYIRVYDGTTTLARMLASYTCTQSWAVASTGGSMLIYFKEDGQHSGGFSFSWQPSGNSCGNGVCEGSADEYDTCAADCVTSRPGALPPLTLQHSDVKCVHARRGTKRSDGVRVPPPGVPFLFLRTVRSCALALLRSHAPVRVGRPRWALAGGAPTTIVSRRPPPRERRPPCRTRSRTMAHASRRRG